MKKLRFTSTVIFLLSVFVWQGCEQATYPESRVAESIKEICAKEYKIQNVEVKSKGTTVGVFLPLKKLFSADVKQVLMSGEAADLEKLFQPTPEVVDQVENVLFATSRVLLSSDKKVEFYALYATDVESTGLQLVLTGNVDDVKRVRLWDISRDEYRKRVLHELKLARDVLWQKSVRGLFRDLAAAPIGELAKNYFSQPLTADVISPLFYDFLLSREKKQNLKFEIEEMKSTAYEGGQGLVYVRYVEIFDPKPGPAQRLSLYRSGTEFEYIFLVEFAGDGFKIAQVIPFYYLDENRQLAKIQLPPDLDIYKNIHSWSEWFEVNEVHLGEFLAQQLNRRIQEKLMRDERVRVTMRLSQLHFVYRWKGSETDPISEGEKPGFALYFDFQPKSMKQTARSMDEILANEDVRYVMNLLIREFVNLMRSYRFGDFDVLSLAWNADLATVSIDLDAARLELFRQKKTDINGLLGSPEGT